MAHRINIALIEAIAAELAPYRDDDAQTFWDTLDGETDALEALDAAIEGAQQADALAAAIKERIATLRARKERIEARGAAHRRAIRMILEATGMRRAERPAATVSLSPGRERAEIVDEASIPSQLCTVKTIVKPDAKAILAQLKAGESVPGAALTVGDPIITIRSK